MKGTKRRHFIKTKGSSSTNAQKTSRETRPGRGHDPPLENGLQKSFQKNDSMAVAQMVAEQKNAGMINVNNSFQKLDSARQRKWRWGQGNRL